MEPKFPKLHKITKKAIAFSANFTVTVKGIVPHFGDVLLFFFAFLQGVS